FTDIRNADAIEACFDPRRQVAKHRLRHPSRGTCHLGVPAGRRFRERDRPFQGSDHVTDANLAGALREVVAAGRTALRSADSGALEILENLLQKPWWNPLPAGNVLGLRRTPVVVESNVEQSADRVQALVRKLHGPSYELSHRVCQEYPSGSGV